MCLGLYDMSFHEICPQGHRHFQFPHILMYIPPLPPLILFHSLSPSPELSSSVSFLVLFQYISHTMTEFPSLTAKK